MRIGARVRRMLLTAAVGAGLLAQGAIPASSSQRMVTVNGMLLGPQELAIADQNAGFALPNGHYWYDEASGYWGVMGGPAVGRVAPAAPQQGWGWQSDVTGDGMIYNPDGGSWQDRVWVDPD